MTKVIECIYIVRAWNERTNDYEYVENILVRYRKTKEGYVLNDYDLLSRTGEVLALPCVEDADLIEDGVQFELDYEYNMEGNL